MSLFNRLLPKQALTILAGKLASVKAGWLTTSFIRWFVNHYGVDINEAAKPDISSYQSFNKFFTRELKAGIRPLVEADYLCPVDGRISQFGHILCDQIFQAKNHNYTTKALVGGDRELADQFKNGCFATLYLSPRDYHRIHMPCDGRLTRMIYVPGTLFSVRPATVSSVPNLFARNERVVCVFESANGPFVLTLIGATIVGSMATIWHGVVNSPRPDHIIEWHYNDQNIVLKKGAEMGRFLLGSTVVLIFPQNCLVFSTTWEASRPIRVGELMGTACRKRP